MKQLPTDFATERDRRLWLNAHFSEFTTKEEPALADCELPDPSADAAIARLAAVDPVAYGHSRNYLNGAVTRLSFDIRHGLLTLRQVARAALSNHAPDQVLKLIQELGWRDFFQRVLADRGTSLWTSQEPYKNGFQDEDYQTELPDEIQGGRTGLACMDGFQQELVTTGYLHNHARMYFAAYTIHWRRVHWSAGAAFFLRHLIDADLGSNNASWQWVASCFSSKPYIFNQENLERFTDGAYCAGCPRRKTCPFDAPYEALSAKLFPHGAPSA